jgi:hypothetical protein
MLLLDCILDDLLNVLYSYSLAQPTAKCGFYIHPVVHRWARERLDNQTRIQKAKQAALLLCEGFKFNGVKTLVQWKHEANLMPHLSVVSRYLPKDLKGVRIDESMICVILRLAQVNMSWGRLDDAEGIAAPALAAALKYLGSRHSTTLSLLSTMSDLYRGQGRLNDAQRLDGVVLGTRRKNKGEEHPDTILAMTRLSLTYLL